MNRVPEIFVVIVLAAVVCLGLYIYSQGVQQPKTPAPSPAPVVKRQLVYVSSRNCPACRKMEKTLADPTVAGMIASNFSRFTKGDADTYKVNEFPTCIILDEGGREERRITGYQPPGRFMEWMGDY